MNRTLIIGASGQIGKKLTSSMLNDGHEVVALVRDKEKLSDMTESNLFIVEADLNEDFQKAFENCTQVVFVAGSGGETGADKTMLIDLWAACRAADYAVKHHVSHFVMVSSIGADDPSQGPENMQPYLVAKHMADEHLMRSDLHYSIIRPGTLTDDEPTGRYTKQRPKDSDQAKITRADVATALQYCLANPPSDNTIMELFNGDESVELVFKE